VGELGRLAVDPIGNILSLFLSLSPSLPPSPPSRSLYGLCQWPDPGAGGVGIGLVGQQGGRLRHRGRPRVG
jgi:hypothetical protein